MMPMKGCRFLTGDEPGSASEDGMCTRMRRIICSWIVLVPLFLFIGAVSAVPVLPAEYYGTVTINGNPAPAGTEISALINGSIVGNLVTARAGSYGGTGTFDPRLVVAGTGDGEPIVFLINGKPADQTGVYHPGDLRELSLSAQLGSSTGATTAVTSPPATASPTATATTIYMETTTSPVTTATAAITSASQTTNTVLSTTTLSPAPTMTTV